MVFVKLILTLMLCFFSMFNHLFPCPTVSVNFVFVCICFYHPCLILSTRFYQKKKKQKIYSTDLFYLANREIFGRSDKQGFLSNNCISLVKVTLCNIVDSADQFYSANGKFYLGPDKQSFDLFDSTNGKCHARSDILCSPSENCISLVTMTPCKFGDSPNSFWSS